MDLNDLLMLIGAGLIGFGLFHWLGWAQAAVAVGVIVLLMGVLRELRSARPANRQGAAG